MRQVSPPLKSGAISRVSRPSTGVEALAMVQGPVDLLVIVGGINGAGIARDAAGRGLKVVLCEKGHLAQGKSSRSGKYLHGVLRYLVYYEFRLVREALTEREVLLERSPSIIRTTRNS